LYALKASEIKGYIHANLRYFIDFIKKSKEERKGKERTLAIGRHIKNNLTDYLGGTIIYIEMHISSCHLLLASNSIVNPAGILPLYMLIFSISKLKVSHPMTAN